MSIKEVVVIDDNDIHNHINKKVKSSAATEISVKNGPIKAL